MRGGIGGLVLAAGVLLATTAEASDKRDFEQCDGRVHPGKQDDGMRGEASSPGSFTFPIAAGGNIGACTRALASPRLLPTQGLRRAHLLRARAAAHLRAGRTDEALADLDAAQAATTASAGDRFFARSMGTSLDLLRALAMAQAGDAPGSAELAARAVAARPYSLQVQMVGASIAQAARPVGGASPSPWPAVVQFNPTAAETAIVKEAEIGNYAGVLALGSGLTLEWPDAPLAPFAFAARTPDATRLLGAVVVSLATAHARAATGDPAGARTDMADIRARLDKARPVAAEGVPANLAVSTFDTVDRYVAARSRQIEARIAVAEGRPAEAIAALVATPMPRDADTIELLTAIKAAVPADDAALVPDIAPFAKEQRENRLKALGEMADDALITPETPRAVVDYERARPNLLGALVGGVFSLGTSLLGGIDRTDGFRTTPNPDGTVTVEFIGNTPSAPMVQEMTLLRAAEVTREAGKPAFAIVERKDYTRRMTTSRGGVPVSSVPAGFKTELKIRFVEAGAVSDNPFDAVTVIDALGPFYYEAKKSKS